MKIHRPSLPKMDLAARVRIWALIVGILIVAAGVVAWIEEENETVKDGQLELSGALQHLSLLVDQRLQEANQTGKWLVVQQQLSDLTVARDGAKLLSYLEPITQGNLADRLTVTDSSGLVLASSSNHDAFLRGVNIKSLPEVSAALGGSSPITVKREAAGTIRQTLALPIKNDAGDVIVGALVVDQFLDENSLGQFKTKSGTEVAYLFADESGLIRVSAGPETPPLVKPVPTAILNPGLQGRPDQFLMLDTTQGPYLCQFSPFASQDVKSSAVYGVGIPRAMLANEHMNLLAAIELGLLGLLLLTWWASHLVNRYHALPLQNLSRALRDMAGGDLTVPLDLKRDPVGLGHQLDLLRQTIRNSLQELTREKNRNESIIRTLGVAVVVTDDANRIVRVNPMAEQLLKQSTRDLLSKGWYDVVAECERLGEGKAQFSNGEVSELTQGVELTVRSKFTLSQDPRVVLSVISKQLQIEDRPAGYVHVLEDASEQEQFMRTKDEFIVNTAHELRGPLAALRVSVDALIEDQAVLGKQELNFMLRNMQRSVIRFQGFAENLIDMGNIIAGRFMVRPFPISFYDVLEDAVSQVMPLLEMREQSVQSKPADSTPCRVFADRARVGQVLVNLLTNASKYSPERNVITLSISTDERFVIVEVTDSGPGIPVEEQPHIFERFFRGKRALTEGAGLGLGMALAKEIVEAHGGHIGVKSQLNKGTTFWFSLLKA